MLEDDLSSSIDFDLYPNCPVFLFHTHLHITPAATAGKISAAFGTKGVTVLTVRLPAFVRRVQHYEPRKCDKALVHSLSTHLN